MAKLILVAFKLRCLLTGMILARAVATGFALLLLPATASPAAVIFDNFGTAFPFYDGTTSWNVGANPFSGYPRDIATAMRFNAGPTGAYLDDITVVLHPFDPGSDGWRYRATIYTEQNLAPAVALESVEFIDSEYHLAHPVTLSTSGTTLLKAQTTYWLAIEPVAGSYAGWNWTVGSQRYGTLAQYNLPPAYGVWTVYPPDSVMSAFRISATLIPIPPAVWLLGSALGLLAWVKRKGAAHRLTHHV